MLTLSLLSRGHGKLVQNKQKLEVYFEPEVSLRAAGRGAHFEHGGGMLCLSKLCFGECWSQAVGHW